MEHDPEADQQHRKTLNKTCQALEKQNGSLEEVRGEIDYHDDEKLGNGKSRNIALAYANPCQEWYAVAETHGRA